MHRKGENIGNKSVISTVEKTIFIGWHSVKLKRKLSTSPGWKIRKYIQACLNRTTIQEFHKFY